ncbi:MAG: hypothetical protein E6F96_08500 [Actinobacteria bacterium]|nr:MAG: hypothetical protein E6F96_08500 [Actinomycetota bacterium]
MVRTFASESAAHGITLNAILPGLVATEQEHSVSSPVGVSRPISPHERAREHGAALSGVPGRACWWRSAIRCSRRRPRMTAAAGLCRSARPGWGSAAAARGSKDGESGSRSPGSSQS